MNSNNRTIEPNNFPPRRPDLITLMGPTASGKTAVAVQLALKLRGVIISGDSRQVYRGMDIGTGKDLSEYQVDDVVVPHYLIDICDPGEKYNIYRFKDDFYDVYDSLPAQTPKILCGGSGLYIESILSGYHLPNVPEDAELRASLSSLTKDQLVEKLATYGPLHNTTDLTTKARIIRAIEIGEYRLTHPMSEDGNYRAKPRGPIFCLNIDRDERRARITERLKSRLENGMIEEVKGLIDQGVSPEDLIYYGLEYKYVTEHVQGILTYDEMFERLEISIHQFAKRQMTWVRGMERRGFKVHYITPEATPLETAEKIIKKIPYYREG